MFDGDSCSFQIVFVDRDMAVGKRVSFHMYTDNVGVDCSKPVD
jgi:hypothetical protein